MGLFDKLFKKTEVKCKVCDEIIHSDFLANQPPSALRNYTCSSCKQISAIERDVILATKPVLDNPIYDSEDFSYNLAKLMEKIVNLNGERLLAQWAKEMSKSLTNYTQGPRAINGIEIYCKYYFFLEKFNKSSPEIDEESLFTKFIKDRVFRERLVLFFPSSTEFIHEKIIEAVGKELIENKNYATKEVRRLKSRLENFNKKIKNKKQGLWVTYYENGNLNGLSDSQKRDLLKHSIKPKFQELVPAVIFFEGAYKDDKQEGLWKFYHKNGQLALSGEMINGKEDGLWKSYPENGRSYSQREYVDGQYVNYKEYFENGNLKTEFHYKNGERHGKNNEYYEDGSKNIISNYNEGELHGLREQYYPSGNIETKTTYNNGIQYAHIYLSEDGDVIDSVTDVSL
jgi:antitoxin component YwqK of YwqJK toxin-antitoxin module